VLILNFSCIGASRIERDLLCFKQLLFLWHRAGVIRWARRSAVESDAKMVRELIFSVMQIKAPFFLLREKSFNKFELFMYKNPWHSRCA
jgi:hypothetical protein